MGREAYTMQCSRFDSEVVMISVCSKQIDNVRQLCCESGA